MKVIKSTVIENKEVSRGTYRLKAEFGLDTKPGQFFMLKTLDNSFLLPRPISVNDVQKNIVSFLYRIEGTGTKKISSLHENDEIQLFGPLGNGFDINKLKGKVAIVGGGIGVAPLFYLAKLLGKNAEVYLGYKNRENMYIFDEFKHIDNKTIIITEDGSYGKRGFVTEHINYYDYDAIVACGPEIMMNKIIQSCKENEINCYVSLERRMACGLGACLGCTVETINGNKRACKDGPVFEGIELI